MAFDTAAASALFDQLVSRVKTLGLFERVNSFEYKSAPPSGLSCEIWVASIAPVSSSGLASTSGRIVFNVRVRSPLAAAADSPAADNLDRDLLAAVSALLAAFSGAFTLGGQARDVDLLGQHGVPLSAAAGYLAHDGRTYRVMDVTLPVIINDVWGQVA